VHFAGRAVERGGEVGEGEVGAEEGFLREVVGRVAVAQVGERDGMDEAEVAPHEEVERLAVARAGVGHEVGVGG
jgi:hypothetical protein